jgi:hypothetical protein
MGIDPDLMRCVASGEYVVDAQAVAAAMLRRGALLESALAAPRAPASPPHESEPERKQQQ